MSPLARLSAWVCAFAALGASVALVRWPPARTQISAPASAPVDTYKVVNVYPHDPGAYTQGLIYRGGFLYESTGRNGQSSLRQVKLETGEVVRQTRVEARYFAEGLAEWKGELYQLTWQSQVGFVYDLTTFERRRTFTYPGEGWGLASGARGLVLSDGSDRLRFVDPAGFRETGRLAVRDGRLPVTDLNELECVENEIFANVWQTNRIARISPASGRVTRWIDLTGLMSSAYRLDSEAVLNGIAYDPARKRLFVTGKLWPKLFEIRVVAGRSR